MRKIPKNCFIEVCFYLGWLNLGSMGLWLTILNLIVALVIPFQIIFHSDNIRNQISHKFHVLRASSEHPYYSVNI